MQLLYKLIDGTICRFFDWLTDGPENHKLYRIIAFLAILTFCAWIAQAK